MENIAAVKTDFVIFVTTWLPPVWERLKIGLFFITFLSDLLKSKISTSLNCVVGVNFSCNIWIAKGNSPVLSFSVKVFNLGKPQ